MSRRCLKNLGGPESPQEWQGALPLSYHLGSGPVRVHMKLVQNYSFTTIWNVIGTIRGAAQPDSLVIAGNHRDGLGLWRFLTPAAAPPPCWRLSTASASF